MILALQIVSNRSAITIILEQKIDVCFLSSSEAESYIYLSKNFITKMRVDC